MLNHLNIQRDTNTGYKFQQTSKETDKNKDTSKETNTL